jgi:hypothetical protein
MARGRLVAMANGRRARTTFQLGTQRRLTFLLYKLATPTIPLHTFFDCCQNLTYSSRLCHPTASASASASVCLSLSVQTLLFSLPHCRATEGPWRLRKTNRSSSSLFHLRRFSHGRRTNTMITRLRHHTMTLPLPARRPRAVLASTRSRPERSTCPTYSTVP